MKENYFSTIKAFMTSTSVDVAILGFYQIVEDKDGNVVKEGEVFPQKNYISNSVEETVRTVLPISAQEEAILSMMRFTLLQVVWYFFIGRNWSSFHQSTRLSPERFC